MTTTTTSPATFDPSAPPKRIFNFSAGPAVLPEEVIRQAQVDLWSIFDSGIGIMEHSHRGKAFDRVIDETGFDPRSLEFEVTESVLIHDEERTQIVLDELRQRGCRISLDDFGTGFSSLSNLKLFTIQTLKIDQSFIRDLAIDTDDAAIVDAIINMAHSLDLKVVAEGVESDRQLELLRRKRCDYVQGHLFGDPMTADQLLEAMIEQAEGSGRYRQLFA